MWGRDEARRCIFRGRAAGRGAHGRGAMSRSATDDSASRESEARRIAVVVWLILSLGAAAIIAALVVLPEGAVLELSRRAKLPNHRDSSCAFCGMTRAFLALARGDAAGAFAINRGAMPLSAGLVFNTALAAVCCGRRMWGARGGSGARKVARACARLTRRLQGTAARERAGAPPGRFTRDGEETQCRRSA